MKEQDILCEATKKLITLSSTTGWNNELLSKALPVLWFGDSKSEKGKVLTMGANPSRWEFLDKSAMKSCTEPYQKSCYENKYLSNERFYHLHDKEDYYSILNDIDVRKRIINSFDNYYTNNPYEWFGSNKIDSYRVEGVLRGLDTSYFESTSEYSACHIDIFPFATISDFNKIKEITERDVLANNWAKSLVDEIVDCFQPKLILVFGRTNFNYFIKYFNDTAPDELNFKAKKGGKGKCVVWTTKYRNYNVTGVSVNLGNPKGFDASGLRELGNYLRTCL